MELDRSQYVAWLQGQSPLRQFEMSEHGCPLAQFIRTLPGVAPDQGQWIPWVGSTEFSPRPWVRLPLPAWAVEANHRFWHSANAGFSQVRDAMRHMEAVDRAPWLR